LTLSFASCYIAAVQGARYELSYFPSRDIYAAGSTLS